MKKLTLILLTIILAIASTMMFSEANTVYYYMPYFHSHGNNVTYCVVSNMSSESLSTTFTVGSNPTGTASGTANNLSTIAAKTTQQFSANDKTVT
ncbi:MAG: hypothetical protein H7844_12445, partial [Nitrospirae bacterium YQR-1]